MGVIFYDDIIKKSGNFFYDDIIKNKAGPYNGKYPYPPAPLVAQAASSPRPAWACGLLAPTIHTSPLFF